MFEEDNAKVQKEKYQLLTEQNVIKEAVTKELLFLLGLAQEEEESVEIQVGKLIESIQQLQVRVTKFELQAVSSTSKEVRDQREEVSRSARISEAKETGSTTQEAQQQASTMQAQMNSLTIVEKMKRS
jgi:hypothetical protein